MYQKACERIATDLKTPKYAAIDIIMWLALTDPNILALKPGNLMVQILDNDPDQINNFGMAHDKGNVRSRRADFPDG